MHEGVTLHMYPTTAAPVSIELGSTTVQDLILDLGRPAQVFYKTDDRMKIHSDSTSGSDTEADCELISHALRSQCSSRWIEISTTTSIMESTVLSLALNMLSKSLFFIPMW